MALTSIAGSVASAIIKNLVNACFSYLKAYRVLRGTRGELERLQLAIPQILAVLTAVEEASSIAEQNEVLDTWLWQLRDAVENAEDMLDELEYYELKKTIQDRDDKQEHFKYLGSLTIYDCEKLEYVPPEFFRKPAPLRYLFIENCPKLTTRGISDIRLPFLLDHLTIGSCGDLQVPLLQLFPNLTCLIQLRNGYCKITLPSKFYAYRMHAPFSRYPRS